MAPSTLNGGFPGGSDGKEPGCNAATPVRSLGQEDLLEKGITPTPVFLPGDSMERGGWRTAVHRVVESATAEWLSTLNTQTTLIYSLSTLCPTYTSSCHIQWGCPGSCEGLPEVLNLQKKKGNSLHTLFLPLVSASSYDCCQTPAGLKWDVAPRAMPGSGED